MAETKTVKTVLGELEFDKKSNHYTMSADQLYKRMEDAGVPNAKETTKVFMKATHKVLEDMAHFVSDKAKETMQDTTIAAGVMPFRLEAGTVISKEVNVPGRDGQPTTRKMMYGVTSAKIASKTPSFIKKDDYLHKNAEEIEKELTKNGNRIKIAG